MRPWRVLLIILAATVLVIATFDWRQRTPVGTVPAKEGQTDSGPQEPSPWGAPLRGRLVDAGTGEPLARLPFLVEGQRVVTDEDGWFESEAAFPQGPHLISFDAGSTRDWTLELAHGPARVAAGQVEYQVSAGPAYVLVGAAVGEERLASLVSRFSPNIPPATALVRAGQVRFAPLSRALRERGPWRLVIEDGDRVLQGDVSRVVGASHAPVSLNAGANASAEFTVRSVGGELPLGVRGGVRSLDVPEEGWRPLEWSAGSAELSPLPAGRYEMAITCSGFHSEVLSFDALPGQRTRVPVVLRAAQRDGELEVLLESTSGEYRGDTSVVITPVTLEDPTVTLDAFSTPVAWEERSGRWIGRALATELPSGEYKVVPTGGRFLCWSPASVTREVRSEEETRAALVRLLDSGDEAELLLRVFDQESGEWLDEYGLEVFGRGCNSSFSWKKNVSQDHRSLDESALSAVPDEVDVTWCVSQPGYGRVCGNLEEFGDPEWIDGRWVRTANIHLIPE